MLKRVGFFDFEHGRGDPFECLEEALDRAVVRGSEGGIGDSLIVLPEAFNLGEPYYPSSRALNARREPKVPLYRALANLRDWAVKYDVVFIAGLLDSPFSSVFWVDPYKPPTLMCHKMGEDFSGTYSKCDGHDPNNPITQYGACVGALICLDSIECQEETPAARSRRERLISEIKSHGIHKILCVPAHMSNHCNPQEDGVWCVLASSGQQRSWVRDPKGQQRAAGDRGQLCFADLCPEATPSEVPNSSKHHT
jgi:hypothetical protein